MYPSDGHSPPASAVPAAAWSYDAVLFDMDGVITDTAAVHSAAWKRMFDEFLQLQAAAGGPEFRPFSHARDYRAFVDGKSRHDGVAAFLRSRGFDLPWGEADDPAGRETICGLGNRKNEIFNTIVAAEGVRTHRSSLDLVEALRAAGVRVGLATSSRNAGLILHHAGIASLFSVIVDGLVAEELRLKGKPAPDIFVAACSRLGATRERTLVVEDAVSGVEAAARGGFALVVGVARDGNEEALRESGADLVVPELAGITFAALDRKVRQKRRGH